MEPQLILKQKSFKGKIKEICTPLNGSKFMQGDRFEFKLSGEHEFKLYKNGVTVINLLFINTCQVNLDLLEPGFYGFRVGDRTGAIEILKDIL